MINIIICEDNNIQRKMIENIIRTELNNIEFDLSIVLSTNNPNEVLDYVINNKDKDYIYFLDVDLRNEMNGIDLAKEIRNYDLRGCIIFITAHAELSFLTFQYKVRAFDYILKTNNDMLSNNIRECICLAYTEFFKKITETKPTLAINLGNRIINFKFDEILFIETTCVAHKLRIHTNKGHFEFYGKMKDLESRLPSDYYRIHESYIVNTAKIKSIDKNNKTIYLINNQTCYASLRYLKGLIKKCMI